MLLGFPWWLPLLGITGAVWTAIGLPWLAREQTDRGLLLQALTMAVFAIAPPVIIATGPHPDLFHPTVDDALFGPVPVWTERFGLLALFVLVAVAVLVRTRRARAGTALLVAIGGFAAMQALTFAGTPRAALIALLPLLPAVVLYVSAADWPTTLAGLRWALRVTVWPSLALAVNGPAWSRFGGADDTTSGVGQLAGLAGHPNALGPAAAALLLLELVRPRRRWWWPAGVAIAGMTLGLTQSRTATVGCALGLLWILAAQRGLARWFAAAGSVGLLIVAGYSPPTLGTLNGRTQVWQYAWAEFQAHPVLGYGAGFLGPDYRASVLPARLGWAGQAHNQVLQTMAASGIVGTTALFAYLAILAAGAVRAARFTGGASVGLLGLLAAQCVTESPLRPGLNTGLLVHIALLAAVFVGLRARAADSDPGGDRANTQRAVPAHPRCDAVQERTSTRPAEAVDPVAAARADSAGDRRST
jgi:O-antigen ligase